MDGNLVIDPHPKVLAPLLQIGQGVAFGKAWPDYPTEFGIGPQHVDALIAMACDTELLEAETGSDAVWAPVHAWRTLGQLRAPSAVEPLLDLLRTIDDDTLDIEIPIVLGMIGPPAIPPITGFMTDRSNPTLPVANAIAGLQEIAGRHPERRTECIDLMLQPLTWPEADPTLNGFAISSLLDLHAVEAIEPIRDAFRRDVVDLTVAGDMEDVEMELGLRTHRDTPAPFHQHDKRSSVPFPTPIRAEKIGRNEPCPCGSGRKYKKCCLH